jgi:hypothetical protein
MDERGIALLLVLMSITLLTTLGGGLVLLATTESRIAAHYAAALEALYAAEAAIRIVLPELHTVSDWNAILDGRVLSASIDGAPSGTRTLPDGTTLDLSVATYLERCGRPRCRDSEQDATSEARPYGANNPRWQPYAFGRIGDLLTVPTSPRVYVVVWIGDDPFENDDDPLRDGSLPSNPGRGYLIIRARGYGEYGTRRAVEAVVVRDAARSRVISWREL